MNELLYEIAYGGSLVILFVALLVIAKFINDVLTPYSLDEELTSKDNPAVAVSVAGYLLGVLIIYIGALMGPSLGLWQDVKVVGGYSAFGIILLNLSRIINDKLVLYKFSNRKEIIEDRNVGTGAVQFGSYVASALIIAGSIQGEGGGLLSVIVFYLLGQFVLILAGFVYNFITSYDVHVEIERDNVAAGMSFGGSLIAIGVILLGATSGNFISWVINIRDFFITSVFIFILLPLIRWFFDRVIIPKSTLHEEIQRDQNVGAGFLEGVITIAIAVVIMLNLK
ncbi:DUF350 domain-containing protein [Spirochaeta cellobiosiphila]|uniref:DUF350 domain-containing protein n=1 Tax=Spirochaeta cellobiosiphila TaxID=504483 RepID=UPI00041C1760|nr:DUF350 domain-containing protein [Spirochaeta cellobiosiphila]